MQRAVVLAEHNHSTHHLLSKALVLCGFQAHTVTSGEELLQEVYRLSPVLVVIAQLRETPQQIFHNAKLVRSIDKSCALLMVSSASITREIARAAIQSGASDLIEADTSLDQMAAAIRQCAPSQPATTPHTGLAGGERLIGASAAVQTIRSQIAQVATSDANVLITGESGTGKEVVAALIHRNGRRKHQPFVSINCAAIPDTLLESELFGHERGAFTGAHASKAGKLQQASGGTLFLDEVGDMSLLSQAKILRAIESRVVQRLGGNTDMPVDLRILAATNQELEQLAAEKKFRQDLYFRLNVVRMHLPPLRERREDIPALTEHILRELSASQRTPPRRLRSDVISRLELHDWPGNIRELRNVVESMVVFSSAQDISIGEVPNHIRERLKSSGRRNDSERTEILKALNSAEWNREKAARILRCSRMTLYRKMVKHSISN